MMAATDTSRQESAAGETASYRSISAVAIASLLVALASPLAVVNPLLLVVPVLAIGLAVVALRRIQSDPQALTGSGFALAALFVAVAVLAFVPARFYFRTQVLGAYAREVGDTFLNLVREERYLEAHQLASQRQAQVSGLEELTQYYENDEFAGSELHHFYGMAAMARLRKLEGDFNYDLVSLTAGQSASDGDIFAVQYRIVPTSGQTRPFPVWIFLRREIESRTGSVTWQVTDIALTERGSRA